MEYKQALDRLWNHANLPERGLQREDSFIYVAAQAGKTKVRCDFQPLYEDIMACLVAVNTSLNGPVPSGRVGGSSQPLDPTLCYCVSGILSAGWRFHFQWQRRGLFDPEFVQKFASMLLRIGIAWDQVLAGDIDDIVADAELQFGIDQT